MTDQIDDRLAAAGTFLAAESDVPSALSAMWDARSEEARGTRRRRILLPAISIGAVLAVSGAGAVVATQWQPWEMADPDIVVARDWTDGYGTYLGSCETRLDASALPSDAYTAARDILDSLDVESMNPNTELVAGGLLAVGRLDDLSRLIPGAVASDYDVNHSGELWSDAAYSDARIMQDALMHEVFVGMAQELAAQEPVLDAAGISSRMETQCTTDAARSADQ